MKTVQLAEEWLAHNGKESPHEDCSDRPRRADLGGRGQDAERFRGGGGGGPEPVPAPLRGRPRVASEAGGSLRPAEEQVRAVLESWPGVFHEGEEVIGFWGLALGPTGHGFEVGSQRLLTWCAWDALFIPELIVQRALVSSRDPVTGEEIALTVGPEAIEEASSSDVAVSFLDPSAIDFDDDVILNFCSYVHFFTSPASGLQWVAEHPATFLLTLEEAFDLGHRTNRARYGTAL
jgi:alkylmercury lyase